MEYTKEQRLDAYTYALLGALYDEEFPNRALGLCELLAEWVNSKEKNVTPYDSVMHWHLTPEMFPEFFDSRPKQAYRTAGWFGFNRKGQKRRIAHISKLIDNFK